MHNIKQTPLDYKEIEACMFIEGFPVEFQEIVSCVKSSPCRILHCDELESRGRSEVKGVIGGCQ